ncbi:hypothetical protein H4R19_005247, partial [Coemansia spiralis]
MTGSWRSTGASRANGGALQAGSGALYDDRAEPEWMDDGLAYDENQNAQQMQVMEEWKRRMREGAAADSYGDQLHPADDRAAHRESRFLRLFSETEAPQVPPGASYLPGANYPHAAAVLPPSALPHELADPAGMLFGAGGPMPGAPGDQLSKLFKVFGDKVATGGAPNNWAPPPEANGAVQPQPQRPPESESKAPAKALAASQRIKSTSPAPINEALRGIVPTSVFRKSVQTNGAAATAAAAASGSKHPDSNSSTRSATPARNLPSWLVELSRGAAAPAAASEPPTSNSSSSNSVPGPRDLVDSLERGFPALSIRPQHGDTQSISSLSVQASAGALSETNDGSARHSSIGSHGTERDVGSGAPAHPPRMANAGDVMSTVADGQ